MCFRESSWIGFAGNVAFEKTGALVQRRASGGRRRASKAVDCAAVASKTTPFPRLLTILAHFHVQKSTRAHSAHHNGSNEIGFVQKERFEFSASGATCCTFAALCPTRRQRRRSHFRKSPSRSVSQTRSPPKETFRLQRLLFPFFSIPNDKKASSTIAILQKRTKTKNRT